MTPSTKTYQPPVYINQYPYHEDFELGAGGWYSTGDKNTWRLRIPDSTLSKGMSGFFAWVWHKTPAYRVQNGAYVESPCFDFSSLSLPFISLRLNLMEADYSLFGNPRFNRISAAKLQYSIDDGSSWQNLGKLDSTWYNSQQATSFPDLDSIGWVSYNKVYPQFLDWFTVETFAPQLAGEPQVRFRMNFFDADFASSGSIGFDKISIQQAPPNLVLTGKISPAGGCEPNRMPVCIEVKNNSDEPFINPMFTYRLNNGGAVRQTYNDTIHPRSTIEFCFSRIPKTFAGQAFRIIAWVDHPLDALKAHDTVTVYAPARNMEISQFPYLQTFDGDNWQRDSLFGAKQEPGVKTLRPLPEGWENIHLDQSIDWQVWSRRNDLTFLEDRSQGGGEYLQTWFDNSSFQKQTLLYTPCFNIQALSHPHMRFYLKSSPTGVSPSAVAIHIDLIKDGVLIPDFETLSPRADGWRLHTISLEDHKGLVSFRFRLSAQIMPEVSLDNFEIWDQYETDVAVSQILEPEPGSCGDAADQVWVELHNVGTSTQTGFNVSFHDGTGNIITSTFLDSLASGERKVFQVGTINSSSGGVFPFEAYTDLSSDSVRANDTLRMLVDIGPTLSQQWTVRDSILLCQSDPVRLHVNQPDPVAIYRWFDSTGALLAIGDTFTTPINQGDTEYFVEENQYARSLMITEINTGFPWTVEVKNMSRGEIDARGWTVFIRNLDLASPYVFSWPLLHFDPGEVQYRDGNRGANSLGGGGLFFNPLPLGGKGWVLIVDDSCNIVDFVPFGIPASVIAQSTIEYIDSEFRKLNCGRSAPLAPHWQGDGVQSIRGYVIRRVDSIDTDQASDWASFTTDDPGVASLQAKHISCSSQQVPINIWVRPPLKPSLPDLQQCGGFSLDAGPGYQTYLWSTGDQSQTLQLPDTNLTVTVAVTDSNGCMAFDTAQVSVLPGPDPGLIAQQAFCDSGYIEIDSALFTYPVRWSTQDTSPGIPVTTSGSYRVQVTDPSNNCVGYDTIQVQVSASPKVDLGGPDTMLCQGDMLDAGIVGQGIQYTWRHGPSSQRVTISSAGLYHVTVNDNNQCSGEDSILVSLMPTLAVSITVAGNNPYQFSSTVSGIGLQYSWDFGDGNNNTSPNPTHQYAQAGRYHVCLTITDTCGVQAIACDSIDLTTHSGSLLSQNELHIYPNPSERFFTIEATGDDRWESLTLRDARGRQVLKQSLVWQGNRMALSLDTRNLAEGIYFVSFRKGGRMITRKIVKR